MTLKLTVGMSPTVPFNPSIAFFLDLFVKAWGDWQLSSLSRAHVERRLAGRSTSTGTYA